MATIVSRVYDALGVLIGEETIDVPDTPTAGTDLPTIAGQVTFLTDAVNRLILESLGDF